MSAADNLISSVSKKLSLLRECSTPGNILVAERKLTQENAALRQSVLSLKDVLIQLELKNGLFQYTVPGGDYALPTLEVENENSSGPVAPAVPVGRMVEPGATSQGKAVDSHPKLAAQKPRETERVAKAAPVAADAAIDVSRLDFRVGRILEVSKHPDADGLYVEKVDLGEANGTCSVVSGLVRFVPLDAMQQRVGVFLCNLKPAKMRGVMSAAMLMCASAAETHNSVQPLDLCVEGDAQPQPGDRVVVAGYPGTPDAQLNPKKKIFEAVKPDLRVDALGFASYKGVRWTVEGRPGVYVKAASLTDVAIA